MLQSAEQPVQFECGASSDAPLPTWDSEALLMSIVSNANVQSATGLDRQTLLRRLAAQWTPELAYKECEPGLYFASTPANVFQI